jgi:hypothetical protein
MSKTKGSFTKRVSKKQRIYKMKGCSRTRKNYLGGNADISLAYTGKPIFSVPNPSLAYTGKGGGSNIPLNTNAANPAYPNTGPVTNGVNTIFNNPSNQRGGCGCNMIGGAHKSLKHRDGCCCSGCKKTRMTGGNALSNGLVGDAWTPNVNGWPGVDGISGNRNFLQQNLYNNGDPQTSMLNVGANPPFLNAKGGRKRKQKGGTLSNLMSQDLINLGRQFQFGIGSAYNALAGYTSPVNPLPWRDQFPNRTVLSHSTI